MFGEQLLLLQDEGQRTTWICFERNHRQLAASLAPLRLAFFYCLDDRRLFLYRFDRIINFIDLNAGFVTCLRWVLLLVHYLRFDTLALLALMDLHALAVVSGLIEDKEMRVIFIVGTVRVEGCAWHLFLVLRRAHLLLHTASKFLSRQEIVCLIESWDTVVVILGVPILLFLFELRDVKELEFMINRAFRIGGFHRLLIRILVLSCRLNRYLAQLLKLRIIFHLSWYRLRLVSECIVASPDRRLNLFNCLRWRSLDTIALSHRY